MNLDSRTESKLSLRDRQKSATRDAILAAATDVLAASGDSAARMEDIALRAGVAVGTVYNYFEDRTALMRALLDTRTQALLEALAQDARPVGPRGPDAPRRFTAALRHFVGALIAHLDANRAVLASLQHDERTQGIGADVVSRRQSVLQALHGRATQLVTEGIRSGALRKADADTCATLLIGMVRSVAIRRLAAGDERQPGPGVRDVVDMFLRGAAR